ncbi:MAG: hypothetical protein HFG76_02560 [Hungatella sp.]|nr:hypothetical protein [Hungatella sp.]
MENQMPWSPKRRDMTVRLAASSTRLRLTEMVKAGRGRSMAVKNPAKITLNPMTRNDQAYIRRADME